MRFFSGAVSFSRILIFLCIVSLFGGCSTNVKRQNFQEAYRSGHYAEAAEIILKENSGTGNGEIVCKDVHALLEGGLAYRTAGNFQRSIKVFDRCEEFLKERDARFKEGEAAGSVLLNDNVIPYTGEIYDGIMLNTYKALDFMVLNDRESARIELNRSYDRQRRAVEFFEKEIQKVNAEVQQETANLSESERKGLEQSTSPEQIQSIITQNYSTLDQWSAYPDFVNPFATFLQGIYTLLNANGRGDIEKANDLLKRTSGMNANNTYAMQDFLWTEKILEGKTSVQNGDPTVWVLFENGMGATKENIRVDVPLFIVTDKVDYAGIAMPCLVPGRPAFSCLEIEGSPVISTQCIADMDRIVATEFKKDLNGTIARAIARTFIKTFMQYYAKKEGGVWGGTLMTLFNAATNEADTRIWTSLPKDFQIARLPRPADNHLRIAAPETHQPLLDLELPEGRYTFVHVKIIAPELTPVYSIITFPNSLEGATGNASISRSPVDPESILLRHGYTPSGS